MINQQLLDYIKGQLERGIDKDLIKKSLIDSGWQENAINEALNSLLVSVPVPSSRAAMPSSQTRTEQVSTNVQPRKIGGWLTWIEWGLIASIFYSLQSAYESFFTNPFAKPLAGLLFIPTAVDKFISYHRILSMAQGVIDVILALFAIYLVYLMNKKKISFIGLYIKYLIIVIVDLFLYFAILYFVLMPLLGDVDSSAIRGEMLASLLLLGLNVVLTIVLVFYFRKSKRVKETLVN